MKIGTHIDNAIERAQLTDWGKAIDAALLIGVPIAALWGGWKLRWIVLVNPELQTQLTQVAIVLGFALFVLAHKMFSSKRR